MEIHEIDQWVVKNFHSTRDFWPEDIGRSVAHRAKKIWDNLHTAHHTCEVCGGKQEEIHECYVCGKPICDMCCNRCPSCETVFCEDCQF